MHNDLDLMSYTGLDSYSGSGSSPPVSSALGKSLGTTVVLGSLFVVGILSSGTGGSYAPPDTSFTSNMVSYPKGSQGDLTGRQPSKQVPLQITVIRHSLGLNVTDLAKAMRVERPTIYAWTRGESYPHRAKIKRLNCLYRLAQEWKSLSHSPMGELRNTQLNDGSTFLESLSSDVEPSELHAKLVEVSELKKITTKPIKHFSMRSVAAEHHFAPMPESISRSSVEGETNYVRFPDEG